ncbi:MAG: PAS domain S-box protein [Candidatus Sulfotelmatobacter sp.]|jgi:PAS domain S-box-containing protein
MPSIAPTPGSHQDGHFVQLYTDDGFLLDVLSRFIGGAIAVGDGAVVIATQAHQDGLAQRLTARGVDTAKAISQGRYVLLDANETLPRLMVNGSVDETRFINTISDVLTRVRNAADDKDSRVAVFGELVALLWADGKSLEALRVEDFWNNLAQKHSFSLLCAYPITGFKNERHIEPFLKMCAQHSSVVPSESYLGLSSVEERLRAIAQLQQRAQVLESKLTLQESEDRFRLLIEGVQDYAIFMLDPDGRVRNWNKGAKRIKGYDSAEIIGKHFSCFYPEEDLRNGKPQWELEVAAKEGRFEDEGWRVRKDGSRFWANVIITAIRDDAGKLIGFGKVTRDFTERMQLERTLREEVAQRREAELHLQNSEKSLRQLSLHLLRTQDEERRRIGRDLHDSLGQCLTALKIKLDMLASLTGRKNDEAASEIAECVRLAEESLKEVRTISYLMYPPMLEEMGLKSAIRWYVDGFSARSGINTTFEVDNDLGRLQRDVELALFRVLQESLTNVHRHSGSQTAHIRLLMRKGTVTLEVTDTGKGIPSGLLEQSGQDWTGALGVGLRGMNERMRQLGGSLEVVSTEKGTAVAATVPAAEYSSAQKKSA